MLDERVADERLGGERSAADETGGIYGIGDGGVDVVETGLRADDGDLRRVDFDVTETVARQLREAGIDALNIDLIYGLPHQTIASCIATVKRVLAFEPDRIAVFGYAHVPSLKPNQRHIDKSALPDAKARFGQAEAIAETFVAAGYRRIGLDHFAKPCDSLARALEGGHLRRNFQGYTTDQADILLGFGASAIGRLPQG